MAGRSGGGRGGRRGEERQRKRGKVERNKKERGGLGRRLG